MKKIYDKDLGIDCDFVAEAETEEKVRRIARDHIIRNHPNEMPRVENMLKSKIKNE